jgi:hypothetical protein
MSTSPVAATMLTVGGAIRLGGPGGVTADDAAMVGRATAVTITGPVSSIINLLVSFIFTPPSPPGYAVGRRGE